MKKHAVNRIMGKAIATYTYSEHQQETHYTACDTHDDACNNGQRPSLIRQMFSSHAPATQSKELFYLQIDS